MTPVRFRPWIGDNYGRHSEWGLAVLLLGESHYDEGFDQGDRLTEFVIKRHVRREGKQYPFWTKIGRTFLGAAYDGQAARTSFWNSVAFYNYVQEFVGTAPRQRPGTAQLSTSWPPFTEVLEELQPDVIVTLGFGLWDALEPLLPPRTSLPLPLLANRVARYATLPEAAPGAGAIGYIKHPSTGFRPSEWHPWVQALMTSAKAHLQGLLPDRRASGDGAPV